jgi:hypothetical protein
MESSMRWDILILLQIGNTDPSSKLSDKRSETKNSGICWNVLIQNMLTNLKYETTGMLCVDWRFSKKLVDPNSSPND